LNITPAQHWVELAAGTPAGLQQVVPVQAVLQQSRPVEHVPPGALQQRVPFHITPAQHSVELAAGTPAGSQQVLSVQAVVQQSVASEQASPGEPHAGPATVRSGIIKAMITTANGATARRRPESIAARRLSERWREVNCQLTRSLGDRLRVGNLNHKDTKTRRRPASIPRLFVSLCLDV